MPSILLWIVGSAILDAMLGFIGVFSLWLSKNDMRKLSNVLAAFAAGTLLGGAFFHLLPESFEKNNAESVLLYVLAGFVLFIILEAYIHWHHCNECDVHPFSYMMLVGDALHNFLGGLVLAASFFISVPLGIATIIAIIAHELPEQLGIFGVLVKGGFERNRAIIYSALAQSTIILGALAGYFLAGVQALTAFLVPFAAGNFIYIAAADLIPEMHKSERMDKLLSIAVFFAGIGFMFLIKSYVAE